MLCHNQARHWASSVCSSLIATTTHYALPQQLSCALPHVHDSPHMQTCRPDPTLWHKGIQAAWGQLAGSKRRKLHAHSSPFQALHAQEAQRARASDRPGAGQEQPLEGVCKV